MSAAALGAQPAAETPVLDVRGLSVEFRTEDGIVRAVDGVELQVSRRQTLALVGESGSGKSVTCQAMMGFVAHRATVHGEVLVNGRNVLALTQRRLRALRGNEVAMVFQDPLTSLNPAYRIGRQLAEAVRLHRPLGASAARALALESLREVGIPDAARRIDSYPHEFSGGMRQRVMIAMALINRPGLLIADEPTTALDVTTQAQILRLLARLQREREMAVVFVTHDLGVVAQIADEVAVMYAGRVVERGQAEAVFHRARHPYTWGLLGSIPRMDTSVERLAQIPGSPPSPLALPSGCRFHPRCAFRLERCSDAAPPMLPAPGEHRHLDACFLDDEQKRREGGAIAALVHSKRTER